MKVYWVRGFGYFREGETMLEKVKRDTKECRTIFNRMVDEGMKISTTRGAKKGENATNKT